MVEKLGKYEYRLEPHEVQKIRKEFFHRAARAPAPDDEQGNREYSLALGSHFHDVVPEVANLIAKMHRGRWFKPPCLCIHGFPIITGHHDLPTEGQISVKTDAFISRDDHEPHSLWNRKSPSYQKRVVQPVTIFPFQALTKAGANLIGADYDVTPSPAEGRDKNYQWLNLSNSFRGHPLDNNTYRVQEEPVHQHFNMYSFVVGLESGEAHTEITRDDSKYSTFAGFKLAKGSLLIIAPSQYHYVTEFDYTSVKTFETERGPVDIPNPMRSTFVDFVCDAKVHRFTAQEIATAKEKYILPERDQHRGR